MNVYFFDFDSTLITAETLELLAEQALNGRVDGEEILKEVESLTNQGMNGEITIQESLRKRFDLISLHKKHIDKVALEICDFISPTTKMCVDFFKNNSNNIYIVSAGFRECILPFSNFFNLKKENIFANEFFYDEKGNVVGVDMSLPTANKGGKLEVIKRIRDEKYSDIGHRMIMIGDGASDLEARQIGGADIFVAFTETVRRERVVSQADFVCKNMIELLDTFQKIN